MDWRALAERLDRIEGATSRRTIVQAVAELLSAADLRSLEAVVYLLQGRLRPAYEAVELGMAANLLLKSLAEAYGVPTAEVARRYRRVGDLGLVAEALAGRRRGGQLTVLAVHRTLLSVAHAGGAGAIARKVGLVARLLERASSVEARYLVRIVQGRLRLGVGDATLLEATAVAALGDGRHRPSVEHAYAVRSDLGQVVRLAFARGQRALLAIVPRPGVPVRPALAQRLRSAEEIIARLGPVQAEPKYDGFRLQLHRDGDQVWAFSRRLENVTAMFPELIAGARRQLRRRRVIIEGEAVVFVPATERFLPFQIALTRKRKSGIATAAERHPLRLFAFDLLYADGRSWLDRTQRDRSRRLRALLPFSAGDPLAVTEATLIDRPRTLQAYFERMARRGLEGIVAKRPDAPYHAGARQFTWVKLKRAYQRELRDTVDLVIVGYLVGRGKRAALGIGSLLGAVYDPAHDRFRTVAKIGSGPSEAEWRRLRMLLRREARRGRPPRVDSRLTPDVWVEPRYVVEVLADEVTRSPLHTCGRSGEEPGYALRFPRMLDGVRTDKAPEDATTEREILELAALQRPRGVPVRRARGDGSRARSPGSPAPPSRGRSAAAARASARRAAPPT